MTTKTRKATTTQISTTANLQNQLVANRDKLQRYLGAGVDVDHYVGGILEEFDRNHALYTCDVGSVMKAVRKASLAGLPLGQELCYLVPYGGRCQFQMGYRGLLFLARENGAILRHVLRSVHEGDQFDYDDGLRPWVKHTRISEQRDWTTMTHVYVHFALPNGQEHLEVMTRADIEAHSKQYSKATGKDSPWQTAPLAMAKKTVIRRAFAGDQIPISRELRTLFVSEEFNEVIEGSVVADPDEPVKEAIESAGMTEAGLQQELALKGDLDA